jgi:hypothetical protein
MINLRLEVGGAPAARATMREGSKRNGRAES